MDTPKRDSYSKLVYVVFLFFATGLNVFAKEKMPAQVLIDSYVLPHKPMTEQAEKAISELNEALTANINNTLKSRIQYRIGILYFKINNYSMAIENFKQITQSEDCPSLIRLCSLNMTGQICRMQAKDDEALKAFEELIKLSQKLLTNGSSWEDIASALKLSITAGFAKAEIYQFNQDFDSAIEEYQRIHACLNSSKSPDINSYDPLALDRLSQLHLINDKIKDYDQAVGELIKKHPDYYRTGIIRLESEAVKRLTEKDPSIKFPQGSFDAPARLIAFLKDSSDKLFNSKVIVLLKNLKEQYRQSYSGMLLNYHYAWILDTSDEQNQATKILGDVCKQATTINPNIPEISHVTRTLSDYAKLQQAIISGEENNYKEAIEMIGVVKPDPNNIHLFDLTNSTKKALETLKREVPKDVNNH